MKAQFVDKSGEGVVAELRGMKCGGRQAAERIGDILRADCRGGVHSLTGQQIREDRTSRDGSDAALRFEARFGNAASVDVHAEAQDVAADGVRDVYSCRGSGKISGVMRIAKVLEDDFVEHSVGL